MRWCGFPLLQPRRLATPLQIHGLRSRLELARGSGAEIQLFVRGEIAAEGDGGDAGAVVVGAVFDGAQHLCHAAFTVGFRPGVDFEGVHHVLAVPLAGYRLAGEDERVGGVLAGG